MGQDKKKEEKAFEMSTDFIIFFPGTGKEIRRIPAVYQVDFSIMMLGSQLQKIR